MAQVFISYHRSTANRLVVRMDEKLRAAGFDVWFDQRSIAAGQDWREEIDQAIRNSMALIIVLTPESVQSPYVTYEWAFAMGVGVPVIPVLYKDTAMHPRLGSLHYLDFCRSTNHPWDSLIERLHTI